MNEQTISKVRRYMINRDFFDKRTAKYYGTDLKKLFSSKDYSYLFEKASYEKWACEYILELLMDNLTDPDDIVIYKFYLKASHYKSQPNINENTRLLFSAASDMALDILDEIERV